MENQVLNEDLKQIQERGLAMNAEARTRSLPSAEELIKQMEEDKW